MTVREVAHPDGFLESFRAFGCHHDPVVMNPFNGGVVFDGQFFKIFVPNERHEEKREIVILKRLHLRVGMDNLQDLGASGSGQATHEDGPVNLDISELFFEKSIFQGPYGARDPWLPFKKSPKEICPSVDYQGTRTLVLECDKIQEKAIPNITE